MTKLFIEKIGRTIYITLNGEEMLKSYDVDDFTERKLNNAIKKYKSICNIQEVVNLL